MINFFAAVKRHVTASTKRVNTKNAFKMIPYAVVVQLHYYRERNYLKKNRRPSYHYQNDCNRIPNGNSNCEGAPTSKTSDIPKAAVLIYANRLICGCAIRKRKRS